MSSKEILWEKEVDKKRISYGILGYNFLSGSIILWLDLFLVEFIINEEMNFDFGRDGLSSMFFSLRVIFIRDLFLRKMGSGVKCFFICVLWNLKCESGIIFEFEE